MSDNPHKITICADCGAAGGRCDCDHMGVRAEREMARLREERDALAAMVIAGQTILSYLCGDSEDCESTVARWMNADPAIFLEYRDARVRREAKLEALRGLTMYQEARTGLLYYSYEQVQRAIAALEQEARDA